MDYRFVRPQPPRGSTAWGAQQFLHLLEDEERIAAERERLRALGWRPTQRMNEAGTERSGFENRGNPYADLIEQSLADQRALENEARRRVGRQLRLRTGPQISATYDNESSEHAENRPQGWVGGGRFGVPVPAPTAGFPVQPVSTKTIRPGDPTPRSVLDRQGSFSASNPYAWVGVLTLAEAMALYQAQLFAERREMEAGAREYWREMLPPEPPVPPRDFDPEEGRRIQLEFGGPFLNIPPVVDTPPESIPIQEPIIPNILTGPDPSQPLRFPTWLEHRGSPATQWKTTEYARKVVGLGREMDQELEFLDSGYDNDGQPQSEEWYRHRDTVKGTRWSNYVDATIRDSITGRRILLQTIDTETDGLTPSDREWLSNVRLMYNKESGDYLVLVPKSIPIDEIDWEAFNEAMRPIVREIGRPRNHGQSKSGLDPDREWALINVQRMVK